MGNSTSTVSAQASPVPTEYNVVNGLIGLGEYILMEILSGMPGHRDVQQFVGICKITFILNENGRFASILEQFRRLIPLQSPVLEKISIVEDTYTCNEITILNIYFNPVIYKGIVKFEILNLNDLYAVGISDESTQNDLNEIPWIKSHQNGSIEGNNHFKYNGEKIALELNMNSDPRTLTLFNNNVEQQNYISNIPATVRFFANLLEKDSSFKILKFEYLSEPTAKHKSSFKWNWDSDWKKLEKLQTKIRIRI